MSSKGGSANIPLQEIDAAFLHQSWFPMLAQAFPVTQQGSQIVFNGHTLSAAWSQRQQSIGITDVGLVQAFGVELLGTEDVSKQPVQWFSQPSAESLTLRTWLTEQYRYLDITNLAQQNGWQMQANGNTLQISTSPSRVLGIRQGQQSWGDRLVIDLDQAAPWQLTEEGREFAVTVDAQASPELLQSFTASPGNLLTSLRVETIGRQTRIRMGIPASIRPRVWTLPNPNRLVIDVRPDSMANRDILWAPGIRWRQQTVRVGNAQFPVVSLLIDPRQPGLTLKPIWANPSASVGTAPLVTIAQRWQAAAAINGGFFNRNNQLPLGAVRQNNRWVSGPILNRGAIAWNDSGEVVMGRLSLQETLSTSARQRFPVILFNTGYVRAGIARYTSEWGSTYTPMIDNETLVTVQNGQVIDVKSGGLAGQTSVSIPVNGYLLVVRSYTAAANALSVGTTLQLETTLLPADFERYPQIVGAGPLLIQNRQMVLNPELEQFTDAFIRQSATRSAIGKTAEGNLMIVTAQNRIGGLGPTLGETAQIMQQMGAIDALNLDGGSSTSLYLGGQLLNRAPRTAARVHNGIGVFIQPNF